MSASSLDSNNGFDATWMRCVMDENLIDVAQEMSIISMFSQRTLPAAPESLSVSMTAHLQLPLFRYVKVVVVAGVPPHMLVEWLVVPRS